MRRNLSKGKRLRLSLVLLGFAFASGCGGNGGQTTPSVPGLGGSNAAPTGTPYTPPKGVSVNSVSGASHINGAPSCDGVTAMASGSVFGTGIGVVDLCVQLASDGTNSTLDLPAGLIAIAQNPPGVNPAQNGMLAQKVSAIPLATGVTTIVLRMYCLNRPFGAADNHAYQNAFLVTDNSWLQWIVNALTNKTITSSQTQTVQNAVWEVGDTGSLSQSTQNTLNNM